MAWVNNIDQKQQYGALDVSEGRPSRVRTTLFQVLAKGLETDEKNTQLEFDDKCNKFATEICKLVNNKSKGKSAILYIKIFESLETSDGKTQLYIITLYSLLWRLAMGASQHGTDDESETDDDDSAGLDAGWDDDDNLTPFKCYRHELVDDIARILADEYAEQLGVEPDDLRITAKDPANVILEILLSDGFLPKGVVVSQKTSPPIVQEDEEVRSPIVVSLVSKVLNEDLTKALRRLPYLLSYQPLKSPPVYVREGRPKLASGDNPPQMLIGYRRRNEFIRDFHRKIDASEDYVRAVNAQQAVPWRINREILEVARDIVGLAEIDSNRPNSLNVKINQHGLSEGEVTSWRAWALNEFFCPTENGAPRNTYGKPGEWLDNPLADASLGELAPPGEDPTPTFYVAWKADYRGRIYPRTPWLSPQGGDLQRALFEFAEGTPLNDPGRQALYRYGGNLVKREKILSDLKINGRKVFSFGEREEWVTTHLDQLLKFAESPLKHWQWRQWSDDPMQFLAFCFALRRDNLDPRTSCHFPVQIDGTSNGLQHIAALTGDAKLACAVNVLPNEQDIPGDVYTEVADKAVIQECPARKPIMKQSFQCLKSLEVHWHTWNDRSLAKKVVMTIPYGASEQTQIKNVQEAVGERLISLYKDRETELVNAARGIGKLILQRFTDNKSDPECKQLSGLRKSLRQTAMNLEKSHLLHRVVATYSKHLRKSKSKADNAALQENREKWFGLAALIACPSIQLVASLRNCLQVLYPNAFEFGHWLGNVGERCAGLPLVWMSPIGFPVCQNKFRIQRTNLSTTLSNGKTLQVGISTMTEEVASGGYAKKDKDGSQTSALLPNLIHSLDSSHLMMTINAANAAGITRIGTIHDCLLCHPNEADQLGDVIRSQFADLYKPITNGDSRVPIILFDWMNWMRTLSELKNFSGNGALLGYIDTKSYQSLNSLETQAKTMALTIGKFSNPVQVMARLLIDYPCSTKKDVKEFPNAPWIYQFDIVNAKKSHYFFS